MAQGRSTAEDQAIEFRQTLDEIGQVAEVVVDQIRMGKLIPPPAQWARAQALHEARAWGEALLSMDEAVGGAEAQHMVEILADRWAWFIDTGHMPEGVER